MHILCIYIYIYMYFFGSSEFLNEQPYDAAPRREVRAVRQQLNK